MNSESLSNMCLNCGHDLGDERVTCPACGMAIHSTPDAVSNEPAARTANPYVAPAMAETGLPSEGNKQALRFLLFAVGALVALMLAFFLTGDWGPIPLLAVFLTAIGARTYTLVKRQRLPGSAPPSMPELLAAAFGSAGIVILSIVCSGVTFFTVCGALLITTNMDSTFGSNFIMGGITIGSLLLGLVVYWVKWPQ